jgi:hypothetical protein
MDVAFGAAIFCPLRHTPRCFSVPRKSNIRCPSGRLRHDSNNADLRRLLESVPIAGLERNDKRDSLNNSPAPKLNAAATSNRGTYSDSMLLPHRVNTPQPQQP